MLFNNFRGAANPLLANAAVVDDLLCHQAAVLLDVVRRVHAVLRLQVEVELHVLGADLAADLALVRALGRPLPRLLHHAAGRGGPLSVRCLQIRSDMFFKVLLFNFMGDFQQSDTIS